MPRLYDFADEEDAPGHLRIEQPSPSLACAYYILSEERANLWRFTHDNGVNTPPQPRREALLLTINNADLTLTMHPISTRVSNIDMMGPKYNQLTEITIDLPTTAPTDGLPSDEVHILGILEDLPLGFTKDYEYGLGLALPYRPIIDAIEHFTACTHLIIDKSSQHSFLHNDSTFVLSTADFHAARRSIDRTINTSQTAARVVKRGTTFNFFADLLGQPNRPIPLGRSPLRQAITISALSDQNVLDMPLSPNDQQSIVTFVSNNVPSIAHTRPETLLKLKDEIEIATLESLIVTFRDMLTEDLTEKKWQRFLNDNSFLLTLAFDRPVIVIGGRASVGGTSLFGTGETVADFLVRHSMTSNAAVVEIKTPGTKLLNARAYRDGVYTPSNAVVGAIAQALDQKKKLDRNIATKRDASDIDSLETHSVHCCAIVGLMPKESDQQRSFEMFRGNSKDVAILTFDELLQKLENIRAFLRAK